MRSRLTLPTRNPTLQVMTSLAEMLEGFSWINAPVDWRKPIGFTRWDACVVVAFDAMAVLSEFYHRRGDTANALRWARQAICVRYDVYDDAVFNTIDVSRSASEVGQAGVSLRLWEFKKLCNSCSRFTHPPSLPLTCTCHPATHLLNPTHRICLSAALAAPSSSCGVTSTS